MRKWLYQYAWDHFGYQLDALYELRAVAHQRLRETVCFLRDHSVKYEPPGPWDWDGEYHAYCERCEPDGPNESAVDAGYMNTLPQRVLNVAAQVWFRIAKPREAGTNSSVSTDKEGG